MPKEVQRIAQRFLNNPKEIAIKSKTATADTIRQRFWSVANHHKLDALTRILEVEPFEAVLIFVRTKISTTDVADRLSARGYSAAALNGDMVQKQREQMVNRLTKGGKGGLDILVATDVAARGLDVDRISHVINYDIPYDTEAYIHRIGRTGRAGRKGDAILFVTPREQRMLAAIEKATRQKITRLELPSTEMVNNKRIGDFKQTITDTLAAGELDFMQNIVEQYRQEHDVPALEIAAALAKLFIGDKPMLIEEKPSQGRAEQSRGTSFARPERHEGNKRADRGKGPDRERTRDHGNTLEPDVAPPKRKHTPRKGAAKPPSGMERFRIEVGHQHEVKPANIVGAITNEAGLDGANIGHIEIHDDHCLIDLPSGMPPEIFKDLKRVVVCGQALSISRLKDSKGPKKERKKPRPKKAD